MSEKKDTGPMINVIRNAIIDRDIMRCLTSSELNTLLQNSFAGLTPSDIRGFIYRSISNREVEKGLMMADSAIDYALEMNASRQDNSFSEIVAAAVGTLSMMSASIPEVKDKTSALLNHHHPDVVVAVIENLGHSSSIDNFNQVADLLLDDNIRVVGAAAEYVEACARDAAFRKRREFYVIESTAEEFLRSALLRLERVYQKIQKKADVPLDIIGRLVVLVALMYNEVLDSTDWRRFRREEVDERIYYALEQHLLEKIGPESSAFLLKLLIRDDVEEGMKRSALHTLGRLSKQSPFRTKMLKWLPKFIEKEQSKIVASIAQSVLDTCRAEKEFSVLMLLPDMDEAVSSIIPRSAGAPLRAEDDD